VSYKVLSEIYWAKFFIHGHYLQNMGNAFMLLLVAYRCSIESIPTYI